MVITPNPVNAQNAGMTRATLMKRMSTNPRSRWPGSESHAPAVASNGPRATVRSSRPNPSRIALSTPIDGSGL
jgi:hypothetical protein